MRVDVTLLGSFDVRVDGTSVDPGAWERRQAATLVKVLALAANRQLHREQCLDAIWPELSIADAAPRLHKAAHYARKALGDRDAIVLRHDAVTLFPHADVTVDLVEFEVLAEQALRLDDPAVIEQALATYAGPLLPGDPYEDWKEGRSEHVRQRYLALLRRAGRWEALVAVEPTDEQAHVALMYEHVAGGDPRSALRQYERLDRALRDELGMAPSAAATELRDEILDTVSEPVASDAISDGLVGRDAELRMLTALVDDAAAGRGRTVLLSGPPGIGKTALVDNLRAIAAARGWRTGAGAAAAIEGAWPFAPVLEAMADLGRRHPTLLDGLDDAFRAEIDHARRGEEVPAASAARGPRAKGPSAAPPRPLGHPRLFVAVAELMRLAASGEGFLLVIDDAHDADDASLRLLHYLARVATTERVLIVITRRSNAPSTPLDEMRASLRRRDALVEVDVAPLGTDATRTLVSRFRADASNEDVDRIWAVAGGVPFGIVELARRGDDRLDVAVVGGVSDATRDVLQRVAIAGTSFDTDQFVALSGVSEDSAYVHLDEAIGSGIVERVESGYRFRHALVRDALLADLPPHRQRAVHRDAAQRLDELGASPARIGFHLLRAGDPAAVPYLVRAAETETALGAYRDALALVEAARPYARRGDTARLCTLRGDILFAMGDPAAVGAYQDASELTTGDDHRLIRAKLARAALMSGDMTLAGGILRDLEPSGDRADATIMLAKANHAYFSGDIETATALADQARELVEQGSTNWQLLDLISLQGLLAHNRGEWFEQLRSELRRTLHAPGLANTVFDGHLCVAEYLLYGPVPYAEVLDLAASLRATAERAGALRAVAFAAALAGEAALLAGDLDRAERELQEAVDLHRETSASTGEAHCLQRLAELRLAQGERDEARELLHRALPIARWSSCASHLLQRIYGTMILAADTPADAREMVDVAGTVLSTEDFCSFCQVMYEVPATIACADVGDVDAAEQHLAIADFSASRWEGTAWQAAMLEARAHIAAAEGRDEEVAALLDSAARTFERTGQPVDAARSAAGLPVRSA